MAGLAASRREPVQVCNLQTDSSGAARPGARATQMQGSIAVPMVVRGEVRGVLGIATITSHEWSETERTQLLEIAARLAQQYHGEPFEGEAPAAP
jgi:L-methionine (R)-S-oxide reductase